MIKKHLKEAVFFENRGFSEEAKLHYDQVITRLSLLDAEELLLVSKFYSSIGQFTVVFKTTKLGIEKAGDIREFAPLFIYAWEKQSNDPRELEWLLNQPGMDYLIMERLLIARNLFNLGSTDKAYMISLEVGELAEREFREKPSENEIYVHTVLNLVELEYAFRNLTQARFHLRKLIFLERQYLTRLQDIGYWAAILDEMANLVTRSDWLEIEHQITGDVLTISRFYYQLSQGKIAKQIADTLVRIPFQDEILDLKRNSYIRLVKRLQGCEDWFKGIEYDVEKTPDDLLLTLLYADYLKMKDQRALSNNLWEKQFEKYADRTEAIKSFWDSSKRVRSTSLKQLEEVMVTFLGGGEKIGGTSILISVNEHHLLLDAGMHLNEEAPYPDYTPLYEQGLTLEDMDALLISHAHTDHSGALPDIHKQCRSLPIYATEATIDLMKLLLLDSARIGKGTTTSLYSEEDVQRTLMSVRPVDFNHTFTIPSKNKEWKVTYFPSGHILGAGSIHIEIEGITILFTGDYSLDDQKTVKGLALPETLKVDYLITESTYGYLPTNASMNRSQQEKLFVEAIKRTMSQGGSVLIPAFALGRAQEIILILKDTFKKERFLPFNLFLDGRVIDVCSVYQRYSERHRYINPAYFQNEDDEYLFFGGGVQSAQEIYSNHRNSDFTFKDFMEDYIQPGNNCIVASSGMLLDNSASARYAEYMISETRNSIAFTGYLDEESPGKHILQKVKLAEESKVKINSVEKTVRAKIESFRLSAHASREQILKLIIQLHPKKVFLMHGEHEKKYKPVQSIVPGEKVYPTLIELLECLKDQIEVIPAYNGKSYPLERRE